MGGTEGGIGAAARRQVSAGAAERSGTRSGVAPSPVAVAAEWGGLGFAGEADAEGDVRWRALPVPGEQVIVVVTPVQSTW